MCLAFDVPYVLGGNTVGYPGSLDRIVFIDVDILPGQGVARSVDAGPETADTGLSIMIVLHVFFTRPDQLDRVMHICRDACCLYRKVGKSTAPKASTQVLVVDLDLRQRHVERIGNLFRKAQRVLRAQPQLTLAVVHPGRAIHRLHCRVGEIGYAVLGFEHSCSSRHGIAGIAVLVVSTSVATGLGIVQSFCKLLENISLIDSCTVGTREIHGDSIERGLGLPVTIGDDGHCIAEIDDLPYARHGLCRSHIYGLDGAAEHG